MMLSAMGEEGVVRAIQGLRAKHTSYVTGLTVWSLNKCYSHVFKPLTKLVKFHFRVELFLLLLKTAKVIPIFFKGQSSLGKQLPHPVSVRYSENHFL